MALTFLRCYFPRGLEFLWCWPASQFFFQPCHLKACYLDYVAFAFSLSVKAQRFSHNCCASFVFGVPDVVVLRFFHAILIKAPFSFWDFVFNSHFVMFVVLN